MPFLGCKSRKISLQCRPYRIIDYNFKVYAKDTSISFNKLTLNKSVHWCSVEKQTRNFYIHTHFIHYPYSYIIVLMEMNKNAWLCLKRKVSSLLPNRGVEDIKKERSQDFSWGINLSVIIDVHLFIYVHCTPVRHIEYWHFCMTCIFLKMCLNSLWSENSLVWR